MTAWRAIRHQGSARGGETVAVIGCGGVGLAAVEIAACLGAEVIAIDVDEDKLALAMKLGARAKVNARGLGPEAVGGAVRNLTERNRGADVAVDALGLQQTVNSALFSLKKRGRLAQVGLTSQEEKGFPKIPLDLMVMNELQMAGSQGNPHWGYDELMTLVAKGRLKPQWLVTREVRLSDIGAVLYDMDTFKTTGYVIVTDLAA
jgi:propanol-preferring alcohol dehydrogenase